VSRADKTERREKMITLSGRAIEKLKESNLEEGKNTIRVFISGMG
jgi:Fe-S cluster assembly iron-binding protein IscA